MSRLRLVFPLVALALKSVSAGAQQQETTPSGNLQGTQASKPASAKSSEVVRVVDLTRKDGSDLAILLKAQYAAAVAASRTPFLEIGATWCGPCKTLAASLGDARMIDAFAGTYIIHVDVDEWKSELSTLGYSAMSIPAFFPITEAGKPVGPAITGNAWGQDIPENMAPPLKKFFTSYLKKKS